MSQTETLIQSNVVAVYPDQTAAERAVRNQDFRSYFMRAYEPETLLFKQLTHAT